MQKRLPPRLLALSPGTIGGRGAWTGFLRAVGAAFEAGLRGLVLREPALCDRESFELAGASLELARRFDAWVAVHDRAHVALAAGAHGVHLGFRSLAPAVVQKLAASDVAVGFSAHASDGEGADEGADYVLLGPLLDTPSKRGRLAPLGFRGFAAERARRKLPVWAIGGVRAEHVGPALQAGAAGVAVLSGIFGTPDPAQSAAEYVAALERHG